MSNDKKGQKDVSTTNDQQSKAAAGLKAWCTITFGFAALAIGTCFTPEYIMAPALITLLAFYVLVIALSGVLDDPVEPTPKSSSSEQTDLDKQ